MQVVIDLSVEPRSADIIVSGGVGPYHARWIGHRSGLPDPTVNHDVGGGGRAIVTVTAPPDGLVTAEPSVDVTGSVRSAVAVTVNGREASLSGATFAVERFPLNEGTNVLVVTAEGATGQVESETVSVRLDPLRMCRRNFPTIAYANHNRFQFQPFERRGS